MKNSDKLAAARGRILPFEQGGDFFLRRGQNKLDDNRLPDAIAMYRMALRRDPENTDAKLALAEALTETCRFDESNRILFGVVNDKEAPPDCYFGLGCNFVGLQEYDSARDSFEQYLELDPEGEFIYDAYDMLDALDDREGLIDAQIEQEDMAADEGKALLDREDYRGAARVLQKLLEKQPELSYARNNLALALFCDRDYKGAVEQTRRVLRTEPDNIQAHCNLAIFLRALHDREGVMKEADYLCRAKCDDTDDLNRLCITLMELGRYKAAYPAAKTLYQRLPYDTGVIHRYAMCAFENGEPRRALACYDRLLKLDDRDSVARYYRGVCRAALAGAPKPKLGGSFVINYQVPLDEMLSRVRKLNELINRPHEEMAAAWNNGTELESIVRWGTELPEHSVKHALLSLVASIGGEKAESFLRDFVLQRAQPPELKREAFGMLKQMGAKEPYVGYIDGRLVESRVNLVRCLNGEVPECYQEVMDVCFMLMQGERSEECMLEAANIWGEFVGGLPGYPELSQKKVYAFAAAMEYTACRFKGDTVTKGALCKKYGVTLVRFNAALGQLMTKEQHK